jgi:two-component system chemotaxis response regulator CheB
MPVMNGLETLREIRKDFPELPVVMFSTETQRGSTETMQSLEDGATAYVPKPSGGLENAKQSIKKHLIPKLSIFGGVRRRARTDESNKRKSSGSRATSSRYRSLKNKPKPELIVMAVSTGGPDALLEMIPKLPRSFPVPIVIVQHMPETFIDQLASRLSKNSALDVSVASDRQRLKPGSVLFAPSDIHSEIQLADNILRLKTKDGPPVNHCKPSADVLFRSAADQLGEKVTAVVLTGMGKDGFSGCKVIKRSGGVVMAQDEESSVIWGMPKFPAEARLTSEVLPPAQLADALNYLTDSEQ